MSVATPDWEPGDPLYARASYKYLFNFRDDDEREDCFCADAASWPDPVSNRRIEDDPFAEFIADFRAPRYQPRNT